MHSTASVHDLPAGAMQVLPVAHSDVATTLLLRGTDSSIWQLAWPHVSTSTASTRGSSTATATLQQLAQPSNVSSDVSSGGESQFISGSYLSDSATLGSGTIGSELLLNTDADHYLLQSTQATTVTTSATADKASSDRLTGAVYGWRRPADAAISSSGGSSGSAAAVAPLRTATGLCVRVVTAAAYDSADVAEQQQQQVLEVTALQQDATGSSKQNSCCVWRHIPVPATDGEVCVRTIVHFYSYIVCCYVVVFRYYVVCS
jgi:hypothetical protein